MYKIISNYPQYEINEHGTVRRVKTKKKLKPQLCQKEASKYYGVHLYNENGRKFFFVHRLVAVAFIPNPNHYPQVNHKDENSLNNNADNLEWCTAKYNVNYGGHNLRCKESLKKTGKSWRGKKHKPETRQKMSECKMGKPSKRKRAVIVNHSIELPSLSECAAFLDISLTQVFNIINGKRKSRDYSIQYKEEI